MRLFLPTTDSTLIFLGAAFFAYNVEYAIVLPSVFLYLQQLGATSTVWLGAAIGAVPLAGVLTAPIYSYYLDRHTISHAVVFSFVCEIVGSVWYSLATSPAEVVASRFVCGCGNLMTIAYTYIGYSIADDRGRSVWSAKIGGISKLGMLLGPAFNLLLARVEVHNVLVDVTPLNAPGWFMFFVFLALFLALPFVYKEPVRSARNSAQFKKALTINEDVEAPVPTAAGAAPVRVMTRGLISLLFAKFISQFYQMVFETILTPITHKVYAFSPVENSYMYSGVGVVATISLLLIMVASKKGVRDRTLIYVGHALEFLGVLLFSIFWWHSDDSTRYPNLYVGLVLPASALVFGLPFMWTPVSSLGMKVSDPRRQGAAQSYLSGVQGIASIVAPLLAGLFVNDEGADLKPLCMMLSALWALNTLVFVFTHRALVPPPTTTTTTEVSKETTTANERTPLIA
jgi:ceroid-lipofuscinosis MFS transporter 7